MYLTNPFSPSNMAVVNDSWTSAELVAGICDALVAAGKIRYPYIVMSLCVCVHLFVFM